MRRSARSVSSSGGFERSCDLGLLLLPRAKGSRARDALLIKLRETRVRPRRSHGAERTREAQGLQRIHVAFPVLAFEANARRGRVVLVQVNDRRLALALEQHDGLDRRLRVAHGLLIRGGKHGDGAEAQRDLGRGEGRRDGREPETDVNEVITQNATVQRGCWSVSSSLAMP